MHEDQLNHAKNRNHEDAASPANGWALNSDNFEYTVLRFRDRQAGISLVFDPEKDSFVYNAYCIETKLLEELYTCEFEYLEDALALVNEEFKSWEKVDLSAKSGCQSCVAKH